MQVEGREGRGNPLQPGVPLMRHSIGHPCLPGFPPVCCLPSPFLCSLCSSWFVIPSRSVSATPHLFHSHTSSLIVLARSQFD